MELIKGIKGRKDIVVTPDKTALTVGSGLLEVFATPAMIAMMEETASMSVAPALAEGSTTVGTLVNVSHVAATPVGAPVWCETELLEVDGRKLTFSVKAYDNAGLIGDGTHERFIVFSEKFMAKTLAKLEK